MELEPITHLEKSIAGTVAPVTHLEKVIEQYGGGGGGSVTVDAALSPTSTNPVQNKVITSKINQMDLQLGELDTAVKDKQATTLSITDTDNNKIYRMQFKLVGGKPVIEYNEV